MHEYNPITQTGNGFVFEYHNHHDYVAAVYRSFEIYKQPTQYTIDNDLDILTLEFLLLLHALIYLRLVGHGVRSSID